MTTKFTKAEVATHKSAASLWLIIHNNVYDVSKFLKEHPGGENALKEYAGKDATEAFEDVGHSKDARTIMKKYKIGEIQGGHTSAKSKNKNYQWYAAIAGIVALVLVTNFVLYRHAMK